MNPVEDKSVSDCIRLPRTSGDEPPLLYKHVLTGKPPPHERG